MAAARECAGSGGPSLEALRRAAALRLLASSDDGLWQALHDAIDAPAGPGLSEVFSDTDEQGERRKLAVEFDQRRNAISDELETRAIAATAASRPGMAQRIAALTARAKGGKS